MLKINAEKKEIEKNIAKKLATETGKNLHCFPWNEAYYTQNHQLSRYTDSDPCFKAFSHGGCCGRVTILSFSDATESQKTSLKMISDEGFDTN